jgi:hypothetical protein
MFASFILAAYVSAAAQACTASDGFLVKRRLIAPTEEAVYRAVDKWSRWIDKHDTPHCFTIVLYPVDTTDGVPVFAPMLLLFREAEPALHAPEKKGPVTPYA